MFNESVFPFNPSSKSTYILPTPMLMPTVSANVHDLDEFVVSGECDVSDSVNCHEPSSKSQFDSIDSSPEPVVPVVRRSTKHTKKTCVV